LVEFFVTYTLKMNTMLHLNGRKWPSMQVFRHDHSLKSNNIEETESKYYTAFVENEKYTQSETARLECSPLFKFSLLTVFLLINIWEIMITSRRREGIVLDAKKNQFSLRLEILLSAHYKWFHFTDFRNYLSLPTNWFNVSRFLNSLNICPLRHNYVMKLVVLQCLYT
jgi:hypothetical protein